MRLSVFLTMSIAVMMVISGLAFVSVGSDSTTEVINGGVEEPVPKAGSSPRTVLVEVFTSPPCVWCPSQTHAMDRLESEYGPDNLVLIEHQTAPPFVQPYLTARKNSYYIPGIPQAIFDGGGPFNDGHLRNAGAGTKYGMWTEDRTDLEERLADGSPLTMALEGYIDGLNGQINVTLDFTDVPTENNLELHAAIMESNLHHHDEATCEEFGHHRNYNNIVRYMPTAITIPGGVGPGTHIEESFPFTLDPSWYPSMDPGRITAAAFVQTTNSYIYTGSYGDHYNHPVMQSVFYDFTPDDNILVVKDDSTDPIDNGLDHIIEELHKVEAKLHVWDTLEPTDSNSLNAMTMPDAADMDHYHAVIWYCGQDTNTLSASERTNIETYLNAGGSMFLEGANIAEDAQANGWLTWLETYFKASFASTDTGGTYINGVPGDDIGDGLSVLNIDNTSSPDGLTPVGNGEVCFTYDTGGNAAIRGVHVGSSRTYFSACDYFLSTDTIDNETDDEIVMSRIVEWLDMFCLPDVTLLNPNPLGTDTILSGTVNINWVATDAETDDSSILIDVDYSDNGGQTWTSIVSGAPNIPTVPWDTTSVADGTNYVLRVQATCTGGKTGTEETFYPFSIENSLDDVWHFQAQASGPNMDLDMKPVEITPNIVQTQLLIGSGDFFVGRWETTKTFTGEVIDGDWTFDVYGYSINPGSLVGNLFTKVFVSSNLGIPLDVTVLDNEDVGNYQSGHLFTWTDTLVGVIPDGDSLVFEVWLNVGTGSGGDFTTTYNYATGAGTTRFAYFGDLDAMPPDGGTIPDPYLNAKTECGDYPAIESSNDAYWTSGNPGLADETFVWSDIQMTGDPSLVTQIDLTFEGMCNRAGNFQIWAFNQNSAAWVQIGTSEPYDASVEETVTRSITTDMTNYRWNGTLTWGVYEDAQMGVIDVDYLEVVVHYTVPYPLFRMQFDYGPTQSKVMTPLGTPTISHDIVVPDPGGPWPAWRFLSFPITANGDVSSVLNDAFGDSGTTWDMAQWYDPTDADDHWKTYNAYAPALSDMPSVNNRMGLWVHITANGGDGELTAGMGNYPGFTTVIQLYTGWNLVGYPSATPRTADTTLPVEVTSMAVYNSAQPYDFTDVTDLGTVLMQEDSAYWVYSTADVQWNVDP